MMIRKANKTLTLLLAIIMLFSLFPVQVMAETDKLDTVYWNMATAGGNDANDGTVGAPVQSFERAKELLAKDGEIRLVNGANIPVDSNQTWSLPSDEYGDAKLVIADSLTTTIGVRGTLTLENIWVTGAGGTIGHRLFNVLGTGSLTMGENVIVENIKVPTNREFISVAAGGSFVLDGAIIRNIRAAVDVGIFNVVTNNANRNIKFDLRTGEITPAEDVPAMRIVIQDGDNYLWEIKATGDLKINEKIHTFVITPTIAFSMSVQAAEGHVIKSVAKNGEPWLADENDERIVSVTGTTNVANSLTVTAEGARDSVEYNEGGLKVTANSDEKGTVSLDGTVFTIESVYFGYVIDEIKIGDDVIEEAHGLSEYEIDVAEWEDGEYTITASFAYTANYDSGMVAVTRDGAPLDSGSIIREGQELTVELLTNPYYDFTSLTINGTSILNDLDGENKYLYTVGALDETEKGGAVIVAMRTVKDGVLSETISLDHDNLALTEGESAQLTITFQPGETTNKIVVWTSSNSAVAAVSGDGKVIALSEGTAIITATPADGGAEPAACEVTVTGIDNPETLVTISDIDDFMEFAGQVNKGESFAGKTVRLMADLDLSTVCGEDAALGNWTPIGISADNPFSGLFDGNGHTISGLYFKNITDRDDGKYKALFGFVTDGIIKDLTVEGFVNSYQHAAGIVSQMLRTTVSGCINQVEIRAQQTYAGGIAVNLSEGSIVVDCINIAPVTVNRSTFAGGIVSHASSDSSIINCYNEGTVMSQGTSSGIAVSNYGYIEGCVNVGAVTSASGSASGIAGSNVGIIANCYNKGPLSATLNSANNPIKAAGIALGSSGTIVNCYNIGTLSAAGSGSAASGCFAIGGTVSIVNYEPVFSFPIIENSYYSESTAVNGPFYTTGGITIESLNASGGDLLTELGGAYVADIGINSGYPILKWQTENQNADYRITLAHNATAEHGLTVLAAGTKVENGEHFYSGKGGTGLTLTMSKKYTVEEITVGNGTVTLVSSEISGETGAYIYRLSDVSAQSTLTITLKEQDKNIGEDGSPIVSDVSESDVWNGTDVNVRWYFDNENADSYTINTAAELAGVAALINGLVNEDCVVYVSDFESYTAADWNSSSYAKSSGSEGSGGQGSNQSTDIYYYGIENFEGKTIILGDNIDMGAAYSYGSWYGPNYMPLGGQYLMTNEDTGTKLGSSFCGTFDGGGHYVYNIYCDRHCSGNYGDGQSVGLIGRLGVHDNDPVDLRPLNPSVRNVAITGYIYANRSVGGIVGKIGKTEANNSDNNDDGGIIENCANFATVKNTDSKGCGGIVGAGWNGGKIVNCYNTGNITSTYGCPTAGISGSNEIVLQNCYNIGTISAATDSFAMAVGTNNGGAPYSSITNCWYLEGSAPGGGYFDSTANNDGKRTEAEMKSEDFLNQLGGAFAGDINNINNGYPILAWQTATAPKTYSVIVDNAISGGTVTAEPAGGIEGTVVTVTVTPDFGKQLVTGSLKYTTDSGSTYTTITAIEGVYSFILPAADVVVTAEFTAIETQPVYTIAPQANEAYNIGKTDDGFSIMTVNSGFSGLKYFGVEVTPVIGHEGLETVVFVHSKDSVQRSINATRADFDTVQFAQAGFNVNPGDVVKVFIVDELTNATDHNPFVLQ